MRKSMTFNHIRKPWLYLLEGRQKSPFAPVRNNLIRVSGMAGAYVGSKETDVLYISQPIGFIVKDDEHALQLKDELAEWLVTETAVPLQFDDEPGRTYYAQIEGTIEEFTKFVDQRSGVITFLCADPFSYGDEQSLTFEGNTAIIENQGTAETYPIIEVEVKEDTSFVAVGNGEEINMIGEPASVDEIVFEPKTIILNDPMASDVGWGAAGFQPEGSIKAGTITSDGDFLIPTDYGTGTGWHGPAVQKSLPEQLQDFEAEFTFVFHSRYVAEIGKIQLYGLDATNKKIFMIGMGDFWQGQEANMPEGVLYNDLEQRKSILYRTRFESWEKFRGYIRISRIGRDIQFYIRMIDQATGREIASKTSRFYDSGLEYQQKLASIGLHFAAFGTHLPIAQNRASHITVWRVNQETGIPYIANAGDTVVFDHTVDLVTLNGEEIKKEKAFIGNYFDLKSGENIIVAEPEEAIEKITVRWRERWR